MLTIHNLESVGLLKLQTRTTSTYPTIRKSLKLIVDDVNEKVGQLTSNTKIRARSWSMLTDVLCFYGKS